MRASLVKIGALAGVAMLTLSVANAATLIPVVQETGGSTTYAFGINNNNDIAGSYLDANGFEHGFFGTLAGSYASFDYTGSGVTGTQARGINDSDIVTGYAPSSNETVGYQWELTAGVMQTITDGINPLNGIAQQITAAGTFTGDYTTTDRFAYLGAEGLLTTTLPLEFGSTAMAGRGIDTAGDVVGWFIDGSGVQHGYTDIGGTFSQVDFPGSNVAYTVLEGISDKGLITGQYGDTSGVIHAFSLSLAKGKFKEITVPNATSFVQAFGVNNKGLITIVSDQGAFIYCPMKKKKCNKIAKGIEVSDAPEINKPGGYFVAVNPNNHAKPGAQPKPLPKGAAAQ